MKTFSLTNRFNSLNPLVLFLLFIIPLGFGIRFYNMDKEIDQQKYTKLLYLSEYTNLIPITTIKTFLSDDMITNAEFQEVSNNTEHTVFNQLVKTNHDAKELLK